MFKILWMVVMVAVLQLTNGTTTVDLLRGDGYVLNAWRPQIADYKDGGVWQTSSITPGRQLVQKRFDNVVETFDLKLRGTSQDSAAQFSRDLKRLIEDAADYWVNRWNITPVYLTMKASRATNTQYAIVHRARVVEEENPFAQPWLQRDCAAVMDNISLLVERGHWTENPPGSETCVQVSGIGEFISSQTGIGPDEPGESTDDVSYEYSGPSYTPAWNYLQMGKVFANSYTTVIRFVTINIPQGATILSAYIQFEARDSDSDYCKLIIYGEDVDDAATFHATAWQETDTRVRGNKTDASARWGTPGSGEGIEPWVAASDYTTPDIKDIIQEIVDRPGWVANNDLAIFILDDDSATGGHRVPFSWDGEDAALGDAPELYIIYSTDAPATYGRAATCEQEVYVANKDNKANITHVYNYDATGAGVWSANLAGTYPYNLFPTNPVGDNDAIYFGVETAGIPDSGPFASLVFDLSTILTYTVDATIVWEYWDGAAWEDLIVRDNTGNMSGAETWAFTQAGVNSVHWIQESDWAIEDLVTATGDAGAPNIEGYWMRARADVNAGTITGDPEQQNRDVYTITWSHIDIDDEQVPGEIPALLRLTMKNESHGWGNPLLFANRVIVGLRNTDRGENFRAYLNFAEEQNPNGIFVSVNPGESVFQVDSTAPTGQSVLYDPTAVHSHSLTWEDRVYVRFFGRDIIREYSGKFHVWVRAKQVGGDLVANHILIRLAKSMPGGDPIVISEERMVGIVGGMPQAFDMGEVTMPLSGMPLSILPDAWFGDYLIVQASASSIVPQMVFYDICLMPVDEWVGEFVDRSDYANFDSSLGVSAAGTQRYINIDSISSPKDSIIGVINNYIPPGGAVVSYGTVAWQSITTGEAILKPGIGQRLWVFAEQYPTYNTTTYFYNKPYQGYSVQAFRNARYLGQRGAG